MLEAEGVAVGDDRSSPEEGEEEDVAEEVARGVTKMGLV